MGPGRQLTALQLESDVLPMLEKTFRPADIEPRISSEWEKANAFKIGYSTSGGMNGVYSIVIPPPNVTGSLHMGHALNNTLQDILARFERMRVRDTLWQPGTDHAGIATQMVVERQLDAAKEPPRRELGREEFLKRVWTWKEESGGAIIMQLKRLGASCDWSRERFTMDEGLSKAVVKVFVQLYNEGLIYKDKRLVNWDPKFQTAISDLEVVQVEVRGQFSWSKGNAEPFDAAALAKVLANDPNGHMYYFRYPLAKRVLGYHKDYIVVATTRPETMLGDTGVAVHPDDERYTVLTKVEAKVMLPLVGREISIFADEHSDPEKGTGAVKITPAHDFIDFEVGNRHALEQINILDAFGRTNNEVPEVYRGMDRFEVRKKVVSDIDALGLLEKIEPIGHTVPHGDRSGVVIEPWLTDQWYVNAGALAKSAVAAVKSGKTVFVPKNWEKTYFEWMQNIQPWCISRQLWWGHQIPAWYGPDGKFFVADSVEGALSEATEYYAKLAAAYPKNKKFKTWSEKISLEREEDVLDTWFSSALWPFSTLGWPDETPELKRYYPMSVLVTGFDIIFFWVARMMMMGLHFMKEVPFKDVYIHALVRDEKGQKMSKSNGNVMDPLILIDEFGADALRFTLAAMAAQGRDIKLAKSRVEGYRNFATKLWNASRFAEMNECICQCGFDPKTVLQTFNKWIIGEVELTVIAVTSALEVYKFNEAAAAIYDFVWGQFCDWYLELIKPLLAGDNEVAKSETRAVTAWTLDQILKMLHPFMPFITEGLWAHTVEHGVKRDTLLCLSQWPNLDGLVEADAVNEVNWLVKLISEIRSVRTEISIPASAKIPLVIIGADDIMRERVCRNDETLRRLARVNKIDFANTATKCAALVVAGDTTAALPLAGIVDIDAGRHRLTKAIEGAEGDLKKIDAKLSNPQFIERAKEKAIEEAKERKAEVEAEIRRFSAALRRIENV